jgi:hypothetical protein
MEIQSERLTTAEEIETQLKITSRKLKDLRTRRLVTFFRIGHRTVLYDRASLDLYLEKVKSQSILEGKGSVRP